MKGKKYLSIILGAAMLLSLFGSMASAQGTPTQSVQAAVFQEKPRMQLVSEMMPGWNLGNTLDAIPTEGSWNNLPVDEPTLDMVKNAGFKSIRLPVTWTAHIGPAPAYTVDPVWMNRVEQVVDWSLARGFYVMLDVHHDSWEWADKMPGDTASMEKFEKVWAQIADRFKNKSEKLVFEILNEPHQTSAQMMQINDTILKLIRSSGGYNDKRLVVVCGEWNDPEKMLASFTAPNDPNVAVTVHYYPYQFASNSWNMPVWNTPENKASVAGIFKQLHDKYVAKGIPVILGEYAMMSDIVYWPEARFFMDNVNKEAYKNGITTMFWDDGWNSGFDRVNLKMKPDNYIKYILNAAKGIPNSFVWPGEFYIREGSAVTDVTAQLDLYGNTLTDVYNGTSKLTRGTDYTVSGTTFTLKASYLNKILDAGKLGQQAVLTFKFSQGADNEVNVIRYKTATVQPLVINKSQPFTGDLVVPFNYNGMKIKHAWAVDETGQPVDKVNNWTKYLEGGGDYTYDNKSTVTFRKDFANMFDRNATVTFEMWPSGTVELPVVVTTGGTPTNATITPTTASFDKNTGKQADIQVQMALNGNTLQAIRHSGTALAAGTDYTVSGSTVTLKKSYLAQRPVGTTALVFDFSAGSDPELVLTISDSTSSGGGTTPPPTGNGGLKVQAYNGSTAASVHALDPKLKLVNTGTSSLQLSNVKLRYYYTVNGDKPQNVYVDWSHVGSANITGSFVKLAASKTGADTYLEIGFTSGAGSLAPGQSIDIQLRAAKNDWSAYTQTDDYSFNSAATSYTDAAAITAYISGSLQWGIEP